MVGNQVATGKLWMIIVSYYVLPVEFSGNAFIDDAANLVSAPL